MTSRELTGALEQARADHPLLARSLPPAHARSVLFGFALDADDHDNLLVSLRSAVPMELVEKVRINGQIVWRSINDGEV